MPALSAIIRAGRIGAGLGGAAPDGDPGDRLRPRAGKAFGEIRAPSSI
jgi:hypothetical protein